MSSLLVSIVAFGVVVVGGAAIMFFDMVRDDIKAYREFKKRGLERTES